MCLIIFLCSLFRSAPTHRTRTPTDYVLKPMDHITSTLAFTADALQAQRADEMDVKPLFSLIKLNFILPGFSLLMIRPFHSANL